jgi:hypothetical protein
MGKLMKILKRATNNLLHANEFCRDCGKVIARPSSDDPALKFCGACGLRHLARVMSEDRPRRKKSKGKIKKK